MEMELENVFLELFKLLDLEKKKIIYSALERSVDKSMKEEEHKHEISTFVKEMLKKQKYLESRKPEDLTDSEKYILSLNYINIDRKAITTYLKNNRVILDLNQKIKMIKTGNIVINYIYNYDSTSVFYENTKEIGDKLKENYHKYKSLKQIKIKEMTERTHSYPIDRFSESIFMVKYRKGNKLVAPKNVVFDSQFEYEGKDGRIFNAIKIVVTIPPITIDKTVDIFTSFSLPTDIFEHVDPEDRSSFRSSALRTTIVIQEEIYGSSLPQLNASCVEVDLGTSKETIIEPIEEDIKNVYYCRNTWEYKYDGEGAKKYICTVTKC